MSDTDTDTDDPTDDDSYELPTIDSAPGLRIGPSEVHGWGVFATRPYAVGELIERCPVLLVETEHETQMAGTVFDGYCFTWDGGMALALGWGSLYNHRCPSNARYWTENEDGLLEIVAHLDIAEGAEIFINYNGDPDDDSPLWFD